MDQWLPILDFGATAMLAAGLLWIYAKRMGEISERLGRIIGMLQDHDRSLANLASHLEESDGGEE